MELNKLIRIMHGNNVIWECPAPDNTDRGYFMQTFTGRKFYHSDVRVEDIDIVDIAHALSNICRFGGHTREFYSVAQHSLLVSLNCPIGDAMWGLLHDATEAYMGDMVRPLKETQPAYKRLEDKLQDKISERFGLTGPMPASVKLMDNRACVTEARDLMGNPEWAKHGPTKMLPGKIKPMSAAESCKSFLGMYKFLRGLNDPR